MVICLRTKEWIAMTKEAKKLPKTMTQVAKLTRMVQISIIYFYIFIYPVAVASSSAKRPGESLEREKAKKEKREKKPIIVGVIHDVDSLGILQGYHFLLVSNNILADSSMKNTIMSLCMQPLVGTNLH